TALDAYVKPLVSRYMADLEARLGRDLRVMKSSGGVTDHTALGRRPVETVLSGPAGGVAAAAAVARATRRRNVVSFDMGGTSADFSTIVDGTPSWTTEASIDTFPLALPVVDIESVGAGGGSIAPRDAGGALRVGPESAGADPGPVAYGKGASEATVTDADLVAGALGPGLLGGRLPLRADLARKALASLAEELRMPVDEAALGVQRVVRATMAKAMRIVLARRGLDPRGFALLAFGGAGPMHAVPLAREIGVPRVLVPFLPGAFSAYGILISDERLDYGRSVVRPLERARGAIDRIVREFSARARRELRNAGRDPGRAVVEASADLRFRGQSYEINVPLRGDPADAFRRAHRRRYGYASKDEPVEVVTVRLVARIPRRPVFPEPPRDVRPRAASRSVLFEDGRHDTPVYERPTLPVDFAGDGPAIIAEDHATTVVPPGASFRIDGRGMIDIEVGP
ncbi:MAG: hydantoinase/oxoprolinase family protein, partial [Methanobacteriota archaeon]